ncbi:UNVERIFIED_CONTAM: helix-turn-helix domain-containing protein [Streptococcus canis]
MIILLLEERKRILIYLNQRLSLSEIATLLNRHSSILPTV